MLSNQSITKEQFGITSDKMWMLGLNMFTVGSPTFDNGTESARQAGYKGNDNTLAVLAHQYIRKHKMQALKQAIQADTAKELEHNRAIALQMLHDTYALAKKQSNTNSMTAVIRELDDISGLKQQTDNRQAVKITIAAPEPAAGPVAVDSVVLDADQPPEQNGA